MRVRLQGSAIDGGVGADLDIIFDLKPADLRELFIMARRLIAHVAETVAAEHRAGMNDHAVSEPHAGINSDIWIQITIASDAYFRADHAAGPNPRALSDLHAFADDDSLFNRDIVGQLR